MDRGAWRATVHSIAKSWTQETKEQQILANDVEYFLYVYLPFLYPLW